jgi:mono/diheme cytochrome c family protein
MRKQRFGIITGITVAVTIALYAANVPSGSQDQARVYYRVLATTLGFRDPDTIFTSTLDDVTAYMGYQGLGARDLQRLSSAVLMDPGQLTSPCIPPTPCAGVENPTLFQQTLAVRPLRNGDILAARFFAPKIININDPPAIRQLGWRKLIRLRVRFGSTAAAHGIDTAIILLNFFTNPGETPFDPAKESGNTQVILTSTAPGKDSIYWLDYGKPSDGGTLSLQLNASFDARDFQPNTTAGGTSGVQPYHVPDGCVGCHGGENQHKALLNYLDTDHWFDRLDTDFTALRDLGTPVLFDAGTSDTSTSQYARAFDVIRQFNEEAEQQVRATIPKAPHGAAARTWLALHQNSNRHVLPVERAIPGAAAWNQNDAEVLGLLNQNCFRCHGTIKFNVFDKAAVQERVPLIRASLRPTPEQLRRAPGILMPRDRTMKPEDVQRLLDLLPKAGGPH